MPQKTTVTVLQLMQEGRYKKSHLETARDQHHREKDKKNDEKLQIYSCCCCYIADALQKIDLCIFLEQLPRVCLCFKNLCLLLVVSLQEEGWRLKLPSCGMSLNCIVEVRPVFSPIKSLLSEFTKDSEKWDRVTRFLTNPR